MRFRVVARIGAALLTLTGIALTLYNTPVFAAGAEHQASHWYRCNTHAHTGAFANSDANASAEFAVQWYKMHGYQCLVISDHEHLTPVDLLNREFGADGKFLVIQGEEITQSVRDTKLPAGVRWAHVNGINTNRVILPVGFPSETPANLSEAYIRYAPEVSLAQTYNRNLDAIYAAGGTPQINHPGGATGPRFQDLSQIKRPFLLEVWNAFPSIAPLGGTDENGVNIPSFESLWDKLLSQGKTVWGVASDDVHDYFNFDDRSAPTPGKAWIVVNAPALTLDAVMDALRKGHFYASTGVALQDYRVDSKAIAITIDPPTVWKSAAANNNVFYATRFIGRDGKVLAEVTGRSPHYRFKGDEGYVRASILDSDGRRAWIQPVFQDGRTASIP